jgi:hypothetical protein
MKRRIMVNKINEVRWQVNFDVNCHALGFSLH